MMVSWGHIYCICAHCFFFSKKDKKWNYIYCVWPLYSLECLQSTLISPTNTVAISKLFGTIVEIWGKNKLQKMHISDKPGGIFKTFLHSFGKHGRKNFKHTTPFWHLTVVKDLLMKNHNDSNCGERAKVSKTVSIFLIFIPYI